MKDSNKA